MSFYKKHIKKLILSLIIFTSSAVLFSCLEGNLPNTHTTNPFGLQIIFPNANPDLIFGNLCDLVELEVLVNRELTPNGSLVQFELNSTTLPVSKRGAIVFFTPAIMDGRAFAEYVAGILRVGDIAGDLATVNIGVTLTTPAGDSQSDFVPVTINPVNLTGPAGIIDLLANPDPTFCTDQGLTPNPDVTLTIILTTTGIPPSPNDGDPTKAQLFIEVSRPDLGSILDPTPPIIGTKVQGQAVVEYIAEDNAGGTQVITARLVLPNPQDKFESAPFVPVEDRTILVDVIINQTIGTECFETGGGDGPGAELFTIFPTFTTTTPGGQVALQANVTSDGSPVQGRQVCCDYSVQTTPASTITAVGGAMGCVLTNASGQSLFTADIDGAAATPASPIVTCCNIADGSGPPCPINAPTVQANIQVNP